MEFSRYLEAVMAAVRRLQLCAVSPAGTHSASVIFLHGSGSAANSFIIVSCIPVERPKPLVSQLMRLVSPELFASLLARSCKLWEFKNTVK